MILVLVFFFFLSDHTLKMHDGKPEEVIWLSSNSASRPSSGFRDLEGPEVLCQKKM